MKRAAGHVLVVLLVILLALSATAATVTADYSVNNGVGYPTVFGTNNQDITKTALNSLGAAGIKIVRIDLYIEKIVPNTTAADYKNNVNNVKDPARWNFSAWDAYAPIYHGRGFKVIAIMDYCPPWLSYSGEHHGIPADWSVYQDIVTKVYRHCRGSIDYLEVWNEPDCQFLSLANASETAYPTKLAAYTAIYSHVASAVRSVDAGVPIGGPALGDPLNYRYSPSWVASLLANPEIAPNLNFISYHHYRNSTSDYTGEYAQNYAGIPHAKKLPIFVDEWNYDYNYDQNPLDGASPAAVSFAGIRLTNLFMAHTFASLMYSEGNDSPNFPFLDPQDRLLPKGAAFRLLSSDLGLGEGKSAIAGVQSSGVAGAATNANGDRVAWIVNDAASPISTDFTFTGLGRVRAIVARLFEASGDNDASREKDEKVLTVSNGFTTFEDVTVPAKSVVGIVLDSSAPPNLVSNGGFETGQAWASPGSWGTYGAAPNNQHSGQYALVVSGSSGIEQVITGLEPSSTYVLSAWAKKATPNGDRTIMAVLNYGGAEVGYEFKSTDYTQGFITFTTGPANTSATISFYNGGSASGAYADDFVLTPL